MKWVRACNANSLSNGDLISFDYNNNKKFLIAKVQDRIYATYGLFHMKLSQVSQKEVFTPHLSLLNYLSVV
jgi:nitrite reductase/ring-hydroxylating ferredoxin subunit